MVIRDKGGEGEKQKCQHVMAKLKWTELESDFCFIYDSRRYAKFFNKN